MTVQCFQCDTSLEPSFRFCFNCGVAVNEKDTVQTSDESLEMITQQDNTPSTFAATASQGISEKFQLFDTLSTMPSTDTLITERTFWGTGKKKFFSKIVWEPMLVEDHSKDTRVHTTKTNTYEKQVDPLTSSVLNIKSSHKSTTDTTQFDIVELTRADETSLTTAFIDHDLQKLKDGQVVLVGWLKLYKGKQVPDDFETSKYNTGSVIGETIQPAFVVTPSYGKIDYPLQSFGDEPKAFKHLITPNSLGKLHLIWVVPIIVTTLGSINLHVSFIYIAAAMLVVEAAIQFLAHRRFPLFKKWLNKSLEEAESKANDAVTKVYNRN